MLQIKLSLILAPLVLLSWGLDAQLLRDPTEPGRHMGAGSLVQRPHGNDFVLSSVILTGQVSYAVINNKILAVGELVQGVKIIKINISSVSLSNGRTLKMYQAITETKGN